MPWPSDIHTAIDKLHLLRNDLRTMFAERDEAVDVLALSAVCQEHTLLLGPPGTGKTALVTRFTQALSASLFSYLLTRFTEPSEIFGPLDMQSFQEGRYHIRTEGMLPSVAVAFLDEIFQGSSAILNTLLTLVHERVFHNGSVRERVPLMMLVGASNELPTDPTLRAFSDRFALRVELAPVPDRKLGALLDTGWALEVEQMEAEERRVDGAELQPLPIMGEEQMRKLRRRLREVTLTGIQPVYEQLLRELRAEGVALSDRRMVKGLRLMAGAALMDKRTEAQPADLWPLRHMWTSAEEAEVLRALVGRYLSEQGVVEAQPRRQVEDILDDLALLRKRLAAARSQSALGAHLMALGRLRREVILQHGDAPELRTEVEGAIHEVMAGLAPSPATGS
jgi:MoxR-like ATPase